MFEENKISEITETVSIQDKKHLRYVYPLYTEESCLQCHKKQGYKVGEIRGAISVFIPMDKMLEEISNNKNKLFLTMAITILSLNIAIFLLVKIYISNPLRKIKKSIREFKEGIPPKSELIKTGDEFEQIYKAFEEMALSIHSHNQLLRQKIKEATKELKEANKRLTELNTKKSDFIARASHELRTPLTSIKGAIDYISQILSRERGGKDVEKVYSFLEILKRNTTKLIRMVEDMLNLERIEAGVIELNYMEFNLRELVKETILALSQNNEKNIQFIIEIPEYFYVFADADLIQQVMNNLITNAIKFSPSNSEIIIRGFQKENHIIVEVEDRGLGIPPSEHEKIFEKFYKGKNSFGTGLGLTISKAIVEAHGGIIRVKSEGTQGTCFYFIIPKRKNG